LRLVVPWKYGFKGIKSIVSIRLQETQPDTTWNLAAPDEYGFYANVNPEVDHPRWSQATERRIGEVGRRRTPPFNGHGGGVRAPCLPWLKPAILPAALVPLVAILIQAWRGTLSANPIAEALNRLGLLAL